MQVAFINHPLAFPVPPQRGSVQMWVHAVGRRLSGSNEVIVYSRRGGLSEAEPCDGMLYRRVENPAWVPRWKSFLNRSPLLWRIDSSSVHSRWHEWDYGLAVARDLRAQKCDIIHVMNLFHMVPVIRRLNPDSKIVLHMHCEWLNRLDQALIAPRVGKADLILGCSEYITRKIQNAFPRFARRCGTAFNAVDERMFAPAPREGSSSRGGMDILWVGRLSPEKGVHVLLDAFAEVLKRYPDARLEIIGPEERLRYDVLLTCDDPEKLTPLARFYDGRSYLSHLQQRVSSLGIERSVTFTGLVPHERLAERYREAALVVNPSLSETFGVTLIEAMACELPVIAARAGGMTEIVVDGESGILVEPDNASSLAEGILALLRDASLRQTIGRAARQRVLQHFTWDRVAASLADLYHNLFERERLMNQKPARSHSSLLDAQVRKPSG